MIYLYMIVALNCPKNKDKYGLTWKPTTAGHLATLSCLNGIGRFIYVCIYYVAKGVVDIAWWLEFLFLVGIAIRYCDNTGKWQQPNTTECRSTEYIEVITQVFTKLCIRY